MKLLTHDNFWMVIGYDDLVYTDDDVPPNYILFQYKNIKKAESDDYEVIEGIEGQDWPEKEFLNIDVDDTVYDIVHYIGPTSKVHVYRRYKLNDYLNSHFKVKTYKYGDNWDLITPPKYGIIVSAPRGSEFLQDIDCPIYYDRTDYWEANGTDESWLLKKAEVITCSSKYLSEVTPNGIRIDSGAQFYHKVDRKRENIAVYVGKEDNKVDVELANKWKNEHPEYRFVSIGREIEGYEYIPMMPWKECMAYLEKCKVGLIPLKDNDYCKGQFNLKYWNYKQAGLEIWNNIDYNYTDAEMKWWPEVCHKICEVYGLPIKANTGDFSFQRSDTESELSVWWSISHACNFNCPYCCQRSSNKNYDINNEEAIKVAYKLKELFDNSDYDNYRISILGGEPALFDLPTIIDILTGDYKLKVTILTNFQLRDAEWWNSLVKDNVEIVITASFHVSQVLDYDEWISKASKIQNMVFNAKFIVTDDNLDVTKKAVEKCKKAGLRIELEGARDEQHQPMFGPEVSEFVRTDSSNMFTYKGNCYNQTDVIIKLHEDCPDVVHCMKRVAIRGNMIQSGCKYSMDSQSIYDVDRLDWVHVTCDKLKICNICMIGRVDKWNG